jgi:periplasmic protein TonB
MPPAMSTIPLRKGLAIASLALGLVGLVTLGGCGLGAVAGLVVGVMALIRARRDPTVHGGADVAWAGIVTNTLALLTIGPALLLLGILHRAGSLPRLDDADDLPDPATPTQAQEYVPPPPPPPAASQAPAMVPGSEGSETEAEAQRVVAPRATPRPRTLVSGGARAEARPQTGRAPVAPVRVGGQIAEPRRLRSVSPAYPEEAKRARVQGIVILEATIDPGGKVTEVRVLRSVPMLDDAAVSAVRQWEYTPTLLNDVPVPVIMTVTVNFRLN